MNESIGGMWPSEDILTKKPSGGSITLKLLVGIISAHHPAHVERRSAILGSWLQGRPLDFVFVLGYPHGTKEENVLWVDHRDGPIRTGPTPTQRYLIARYTEVMRVKDLALFNYALAHGYDYCLKLDDDTYVNVPALLASDFAKYDYVGWSEEGKAADFGRYTWAIGAAMMLSRKAMQAIVRSGLTRKTNGDDTCIGETLAAAGIVCQHDLRYVAMATSEQITSPSKHTITLHKCSPDAMLRVHRYFQER
jgi:hypothetical protein